MKTGQTESMLIASISFGLLLMVVAYSWVF